MKHLLVMLFLLVSCNLHSSEEKLSSSLSARSNNLTIFTDTSLSESKEEPEKTLQKKEWDRDFSRVGFKYMLAMLPVFSALHTLFCYADFDSTNNLINALNGEGNNSYYVNAGYSIPSDLLDGQCQSSIIVSIASLVLSLAYLQMWYTLSFHVERPNENANDRV
jgi:hypothetical protein